MEPIRLFIALLTGLLIMSGAQGAIIYSQTPTADDYFELSSSVMPIPAAVWLFGSALELLGWMRRKTK
jgi:hypothetical protein